MPAAHAACSHGCCLQPPTRGEFPGPPAICSLVDTHLLGKPRDLTSGVPSGAHPAGKGQVVSGRAGRGDGLATAPSFLGCSCTLPCDSDTSPGSLAPLAASLCPWLTVWGLEGLPHGRRAARGWVVPENPRTHSPCVQTPAICLPLPGPSWERGSPSGLRRGADRFDSHGSYLHARTLIHLPLMD